MDTRLTHFRISVKLASLPIGFKNYLNNYFVMYTRLTRFHISVALASPAYLGLRIV